MRIGFEAMLRASARPCRIDAALYAHPAETGPQWRRSYLQCDWLPLTHVEHCFGGQFANRTVPAERAGEYNTCLHWPVGFPPGAKQLIEFLREGLVLPSEDDRIDLAMALDWYKIIDPNIPSMEWENTVPGQLVNRAKYWKSSPGTRRAAADKLIDILSIAAGRHPAYRAAPYIVSVPGSGGDGVSVGEYIAAGVAEQSDKALIKTAGPAREPRKSGGMMANLDGLFNVPAPLDAACIVVDDVYKSGMTMRATALAARQAGAPAVYGLAAAKTVSG